MLGVVLVAHGDFAESMKSVASHIVGEVSDIQTVRVDADSAIEQKRQEIADKIISANEGDGVVVLTDIYGGVPSNLSISLKSKEVAVLSGMNVPMLVKLLRMREKPLKEAVDAAIQAGISFIQVE